MSLVEIKKDLFQQSEIIISMAKEFDERKDSPESQAVIVVEQGKKHVLIHYENSYQLSQKTNEDHFVRTLFYACD